MLYYEPKLFLCIMHFMQKGITYLSQENAWEKHFFYMNMKKKWNICFRWFDGFDWAALKEGTLPAPLINVIKNNQDVQYMDIVDVYENEAPEVDWNVEF